MTIKGSAGLVTFDPLVFGSSEIQQLIGTNHVAARGSLQFRRNAQKWVRFGNFLLTLDYLGESVATLDEADAATREYLRILDVMLAAIPDHFPADTRWTIPAGGFYVWATFPDYFDTPSLLAAAVERKLAYVPGTAFYPDGRGRNQMRLSFCYPTEERIQGGVRRFGALLSDEEELYRSLSG